MTELISKKDIPECVEVIRKSFRTVAEEFGFTEENAPAFTAFSTTEGKLTYQLETEKRTMCAYRLTDGSIAGYYSLVWLDKGRCELSNLCVLPKYRHSAIGSALLEDAVKRAKEKGCTVMEIGIVEENTQLRSWYESKGFVHTGTKKFDFFPFTCGYMELSLT